MKVLQIINSHSERVGGAERLAVQLHRGLRERGVESHLLCLMKAPASRGDNLYSLRFGTPYHPLVLARLIRFLRQARWRDADVIHVHLFPAQPLVALAARLVGLRAQLVTTEHNTFNRRRELPGARGFDRLYYRSYAKIVCISEGTREAMRQWLPENSARLETIFNGIEVNRFALPRAAREAGGPLVVLSAGRLTAQKNYRCALEAVAQVRAPGFEYWIAGQGEEEGALKEQARALGIEERARFLGFRDDLPALLARADVFLSSSSWEGFGLSVAEAMAAGVPVVASDVPGVSEVVGSDSRCGFLVDPNNPTEIAARLNQLLGDPLLRASMGRAGCLRAASFDVESMIDRYLQLYRTLRPSAHPDCSG